MRYTTLGTTGTKISKLCLGTMNFGSATDEKESFRIMNRALELGINFFDTADFYGNPPGQGLTETIIGNWFEKENKRDEIVLATKLYGASGKLGINDRGLSAYYIRKACEASLKRLKTDHIDLYIMHHYDRGHRSVQELSNIGRTEEFSCEPNVRGNIAPTFDEILEAMERLKNQDKITYLGSSNFPAWAIAHFNGLARLRNMTGTVMEQDGYSLKNRHIEPEVIPCCRELGVGMMTYSPLAGGLLAGYGELKKRVRFNEGSILDERDRLIAYDKLCCELGEKPADVALAWNLSNKVVSTVIIGPRTVEQLEDSIRALDIVLPEDFLKELDKLFEGVGGEAPEYYSW